MDDLIWRMDREQIAELAEDVFEIKTEDHGRLERAWMVVKGRLDRDASFADALILLADALEAEGVQKTVAPRASTRI